MRKGGRRAPRTMRAPCVLAAAFLAATLGAGPAAAQERFSLFVPTEQETVERMLALAGLRDDDVVVDLGSGDGRVVLTAARRNPRLRGWGVDVNPELVALANARAAAQGVADRVRFYHMNAFDADLSEATVIAMWFWPELQRMLRPVILARARPGTRVVASIWDMGSWRPDATGFYEGPIHLWIVPADVAGYWDWSLTLAGREVSYSSIKEQRFQDVEGVVRAGNRRGLLHDVKLRGDALSFTLAMTLEDIGFVRHEFTGTVRGDAITGTVRVSLPPHEEPPVVLPWRASRSQHSRYLEPTTGVEVQ